MDPIITEQSDIIMDICESEDEQPEVKTKTIEKNTSIKSLDIADLEGKVKMAMGKLQEIIKNKQAEETSLQKLREEVEIIKKDELESLKNSKKILDNRLMKCLDEQTKNIIIARRAYHSINNKYWWSSIFILIFSSVITFIEAVRLIIRLYLLRFLLQCTSHFQKGSQMLDH